MVGRRRLALIGLAVAVSAGVRCSGRPLPDHYGIFVLDTASRLVELRAQAPRYHGNLMAGTVGIAGAAGPTVSGVRGFYVFFRDAAPERLALSRLAASPPALRPERLWVTDTRIDLDVAPVKGQPEMFLLTPRQPLDDGFYALHASAMGGGAMIDGIGAQPAYDFVIGAASAYRPADQLIAEARTRLETEARKAVAKFNDAYNREQWEAIRELYRPSGARMEAQEFGKYMDGARRWRAEAGTIAEFNAQPLSVDVENSVVVLSVVTRYTDGRTLTERWEVVVGPGDAVVRSMTES